MCCYGAVWPACSAWSYTLVISPAYRSERFGSIQYYHVHAPSPQAVPTSYQTHVFSPLASQPRLTRGTLAVLSQLVSRRGVRGGWPHYALCGLTKLQPVLYSPSRDQPPCRPALTAPRSLTRLHSYAHAHGGGASESSISHDKGCVFRWIKISINASRH